MNTESVNLTKDELHKFHEEGYLVLDPGRVYTEEQISSLKQECDTTFPDYNNTEKPDNNPLYGLHGEPKNYVFKNAYKHKNNFLFGKRSTVVAPKFSKNIVEAIENENLLQINKELLGCKNLSLHNSALACVYPGAVQEPGNFHSDTSGFCNDPLGAVKSNKYMINSFVYLVDVDEENAPIRLLPKSHNRYEDINRLVSPYFRSTPKKNNIGQFNFYDEFVPESDYDPVRVTGKAGTIVLIAGNLIHSATPNYSSSNLRYTLAIWFSDRNDTMFFKNYASYSRYCEEFIDKFKYKDIPYYTYHDNSIGVMPALSRFRRINFNYLSSHTVDKVKRVISSLANKKYKKFQNAVFDSSHDAISIDGKEALVISHLFSGDQGSEQSLVSLARKHPDLRTVYLVSPNDREMLSRYANKDYVFFYNLPLNKYFFSETWPRYIMRYFSPVISSYASESLCRSLVTSPGSDFFSYLDSEEENLLATDINVGDIEDDLPVSRWHREDLLKLGESAGFKEEALTINEYKSINMTLSGGEPAWHIVKMNVITQ